MRFVAGGLNGTYLIEIHEHALKSTESVKIAVAYASRFPQIFQDCWKMKIKLTFWGRYDESVPIELPILKGFLDRKSPNYVCKLVPDIFHPKVIWWEGYGVYIGSANLTDNGWFGNIECGLFLTESELDENEIASELASFFRELDSHSYPLTDEIYSQLNELAFANIGVENKAKESRKKFNSTRTIPKKHPLTYVAKKNAQERRRNGFLKEWQDTLQILRNISDRVSDSMYRPVWIDEDVSKGIQADQFLHAFYYSHVKQGVRSIHWELYEKNNSSPEKALVESMRWWSRLQEPPHEEDIVITEWAPFLSQRLNKDDMMEIQLSDFVEICSKIHALRDHSLRVSHNTFGSPTPLPKMNSEERIQLLARWLYVQKSSLGRNVLDTIYYILWGGPVSETPNRIFEASSNDNWRIPHFGISTIGELVGWVMPDHFPPRNGRTSKALTALGYDVNIHSE